MSVCSQTPGLSLIRFLETILKHVRFATFWENHHRSSFKRVPDGAPARRRRI